MVVFLKNFKKTACDGVIFSNVLGVKAFDCAKKGFHQNFLLYEFQEIFRSAIYTEAAIRGNL